jgi:hypothetical protein
MAAVLVLDPKKERRDLLKSCLQKDCDELHLKILDFGTLREMVSGTVLRDFTITFLAWETGGGPDGVADWKFLGIKTRNFIAIVETIDAGNEAGNWCNQVLPGTALGLLRSPLCVPDVIKRFHSATGARPFGAAEPETNHHHEAVERNDANSSELRSTREMIDLLKEQIRTKDGQLKECQELNAKLVLRLLDAGVKEERKPAPSTKKRK